MTSVTKEAIDISRYVNSQTRIFQKKHYGISTIVHNILIMIRSLFDSPQLRRYLGSEFFKIVIADPPENRDGINEGFPTENSAAGDTIQPPDNANNSEPEKSQSLS